MPDAQILLAGNDVAQQERLRLALAGLRQAAAHKCVLQKNLAIGRLRNDLQIAQIALQAQLHFLGPRIADKHLDLFTFTARPAHSELIGAWRQTLYQHWRDPEQLSFVPDMRAARLAAKQERARFLLQHNRPARQAVGYLHNALTVLIARLAQFYGMPAMRQLPQYKRSCGILALPVHIYLGPRRLALQQEQPLP